MTNVILFHHALGVTEGMQAFAERIREGGHTVTVPDLFEGRTFDNIDERLVQTRPGALGALLYHGGDNPPEAFEVPWPTGAGVQVHVSENDPWFNREGGQQLVAETGGELFLYPGSAHLFTDSSWSEYDKASTDLVLERTLAFLDRIG
jgi:dienelactone hydrolase